MSLDQFDRGFAPLLPGRRPGIETLPDGDYIVKIESAFLAQTKAQGSDIVRWSILVEGDMGSSPYEYATFLMSQVGVNMLGAELAVLGVPVHTWTEANGKKFSSELPVALSGLSGLRVNVVKTTSNGSNGKVYHNLRIVGRASGLAVSTMTGDKSPEKMFDPANMPF